MSWQRIELTSFFIDDKGMPLSGGLLYTYESGTQNLESTAKDASGTLNTNPIILDNYGHCDLFLNDAKTYRLEVKNADGVTEYTFDNVSVPGGSAALASETAARIAADNVLTASVNTLTSNLSAETSARTSYDTALNSLITAETTARIAGDHTHSNKGVLDTITSTNTANWNTAYANNHTHANKATLDTITNAKIQQWDANSAPISQVNITIAPDTGTIGGSASLNSGVLSMSFHDIKGERGTDGTNGTNGTNGTDGITWRPTVSAAGIISWSQDSRTDTPASRDIKGPKGDQGEKGDTGAPGPAPIPSYSSFNDINNNAVRPITNVQNQSITGLYSNIKVSDSAGNVCDEHHSGLLYYGYVGHNFINTHTTGEYVEERKGLYEFNLYGRLYQSGPTQYRENLQVLISCGADDFVCQQDNYYFGTEMTSLQKYVDIHCHSYFYNDGSRSIYCPLLSTTAGTVSVYFQLIEMTLRKVG